MWDSSAELGLTLCLQLRQGRWVGVGGCACSSPEGGSPGRRQRYGPGEELWDSWLAELGVGCAPGSRPGRGTSPGTGTARAGARQRSCRCSTDSAADAGLNGHKLHPRGSRAPLMRSPASPSRRPPPVSLLTLLLSLRPVWAPTPAGVAFSETSDDPGCPQACACGPGGLANCSALALAAVPGGLSWRVRALLLDRNRVRALPPGAFAGASALLQLDLRANGLCSVHARAFWGLGALRQLDLSANRLEALEPGTFAPLRALRSLSLAGNRLALLEPAALGALPRLRALGLQDNALSALAPDLLARLPALDALGLRGNPWACGCALRPLCAWLRGHPHVPGEPAARAGGRGPAAAAADAVPSPAEAGTLQCALPGRRTLRPLSSFGDAAFRRCAQRLAVRDLAVICALGPVSFLASLAACLAVGSAVAACRARRRRCQRTVAGRPPRRLAAPAGPVAPAGPDPAAARA
ncbi:leucine-rich repeat-containing protein 26 [Ctenodactylus gundi]